MPFVILGKQVTKVTFIIFFFLALKPLDAEESESGNFPLNYN